METLESGSFVVDVRTGAMGILSRVCNGMAIVDWRFKWRYCTPCYQMGVPVAHVLPVHATGVK